MNLTTEEKLMYKVMKAIYDSGIPVDFKGSMVLKACLFEAGYSEEIRHTKDIDANWYSDDMPSPEQMIESLQSALRKSDIDLEVKLYRMYGEGRSAGFELVDKNAGEILFTMDIDVNRPAQQTKQYEVAGIQFRGIAPSQILADKISVVSSDKVFRRIKDVVDLYYLSKILDFDKNNIMQILSTRGKTLGDFNGFLYRQEDLQHAYEKFRFSGEVTKPPFEKMYHEVKGYIDKMIPMEKQIKQTEQYNTSNDELHQIAQELLEEAAATQSSKLIR